jgi:cysteinyl-tRNA synthetase
MNTLQKTKEFRRSDAMTIRIYNTLTRRVELFQPLEKGKVSIYVCGPTVYDYSHIGHARAYIAFDVIVRYLRFRGFDVKYVLNITNVEDKIINRAREEHVDPVALARKFETIFFEDMTNLGVLDSDLYPRVSDHIHDIIEMVQSLIRKGVGYDVEGNVYFDIARFPDYGKLSQQSLNGIKSGARVDIDENKRNPADFALWKKAKEGEISWDSPWGKGRPGWHIECSAMANRYLGTQFDIHGGGRDLIFPHHENEIAQSEAYTDKKPVVKYWMHVGLLTINGQKMSKSLGNYIAIGDLLKRYPADVLRLFVISTHYRRPVNFTEEKLESTKQSLTRIRGTVNNLRERINALSDIEGMNLQGDVTRQQIQTTMTEFMEMMDDDLNTPRALAAFHRLIQIGNKALADNMNKSVLTGILKSIEDVTGLFGILGEAKIPKSLLREAEALMKEREEARRRKQWAKADEIRERLRAMGILVEDFPDGTRWRYAATSSSAS